MRFWLIIVTLGFFSVRLKQIEVWRPCLLRRWLPLKGLLYVKIKLNFIFELAE